MNMSNRMRQLALMTIWVLLLGGSAWTVLLFSAGAAPPSGVKIDNVNTGVGLDTTVNASIEITGPTLISLGKSYIYTIEYSSLITDSQAAIRYQKPAPESTPYHEQRDNWVKVVRTSPLLGNEGTVGNYNPVYVWNTAGLGPSGVITLVVEYQACAPFKHAARAYSTYESEIVGTNTLQVRCGHYLPQIYMPAPPTPTPTVTPTPTSTPVPPALDSTWRAVGRNDLNVSSVEWTSAKELHVGDATLTTVTGGAYRGTVDFCGDTQNTSLVRLRNDIRVLDISFGKDGHGVLGTFGNRAAYYRGDAPDLRWNDTRSTDMNANVWSVLYASGNRAYAGGQDGSYWSDDGGGTWQRISTPSDIIGSLELAGNESVLWIGTLNQGIWRYYVNTKNVEQVNTGLTGENSRRVRGIAVHGSGTVYIATDDGVFRLSGDGSLWSRLGPNGSKLRTIEIVGDTIYIGGLETGVQQASVHNPTQWSVIQGDIPSSPGDFIRDIDYVSDLCRGQGGLIAGTNRGVWFYPLPK